ncbi:MIZ zinc finger protein (macronuclear) [Tetrahymena thermophila SB210]|uniref:MIZ zinc finger protein n=1 Tax=Tetrahymena thermophila (strain SB210) TaxID=312017 RepID=I7LTL7_TETTS|nr:MIZ zinc finger protein [Tetrahymena thermophila SB210]EAR85477.2 MIZ zinc finger protein [Tetrahymena thermophila SB210]|eukprot:XP_001033140.2 MIZ zinc finger protein [Tetrahymena thermophila SB210]
MDSNIFILGQPALYLPYYNYYYYRNQAQLQQLLAYSQYPMTSQQLTQIQQLLTSQQQPQTSSLSSAASTLSALQLQQAAAAGGVLSASSLNPQQQYHYYQQYLTDPSFATLSQQQQQYIIQQMQQLQQQAQQYQLSSQQLTSQNTQQQLLQQQAAQQYSQQLQLQQQQQQYQNQQLYMQAQQATVAPNNSADKQELNKNECICNSCDRLYRDLNKIREEERFNKAIQCVTCNNKFHPTCVKVSVNSEQARIYECPICTLEKLDPLNKPVEVIQPPTIISGQGCITYFQVSNELYLKLGKKNHSVEIRCIRIDGTKNMYETTWPDSGECSLNNQKLKEYQPLQQNSSLKKRKDEKYTLKDVSMIQKGLNLIQIKENIHQNTKSSYRIDPNSIHVFAIYLVRKVPHAEFISTIPIRSEEECKEIIRQQFIQANKRKKLKILLEQKKQQQLHNQVQSDDQKNQNEQKDTEKDKELENGNQVNGKQAGEAIEIEENAQNESKPDEEQKQSSNTNHSEESQNLQAQTGEASENQAKSGEQVENDNNMAIEEQANGDQEKAKTDDQQQDTQEKQKIDIEEEQQEKKEDKKEEKEEEIELKKVEEEQDKNQQNPSEKTEEKKLTYVDVDLSEINDKDEDKNFIQDEDDDEDAGFKIDKLNVSLNCTFGFNTIKTPAKGKYCKHVQCFSLENMILITEATVPRKWKCPICKLKCYDIVIDSYMQKIINSFKEQNLNVTEISFDQEANYEIHKLKKESDDEDDFDDEIGTKPATNNTTTSTAAASQVEANKENKAEVDNQKPTENQNQEKSDQKDDQQASDSNKQGEGEKKKKKVSNDDPVIIVDEDEDESEQKKKQLQMKLNLIAGENAQVNGKNEKEQAAQISQDGKEINDQEKQQAMNIENHNNEGKENEEKSANEANKGGEMTKEKVEIPDSFFKLKEKLQQSIQSSANIYSDDYTYEEFFETQAEKIQELKLKSVRQSCRNKITKNLKKHYPELVNLIKKDATAQLIASLDQYEQNNSRRNNLYINDYSKILNSTGQISKETATIKNKGLNKSSSTGLHTAATSATLQLPSTLYGYDILGTQSLIPQFSSNSFNLFASRNPSTYNFIPITSQATSASVGASGAAPASSSTNLNSFVAPLTANTAASTNPTTAATTTTAAPGTANPSASTAAATQQYYQLLEQQNDFSNMFNQFQFGFGGQSNQLSNLFNIAQLTQPSAYSASSATDPTSLYNLYMNSGAYANLLGGQSNIAFPNTPNTSAQTNSQTTQKKQKQKSSSSAAKKSSTSQGASQSANNTAAGSNKSAAVTQEVVNKGKADDPICLEDD